MKKLLTIPEFCDAYGTKRSKTYELIAAGELPAVKIGRLTRIRVEDADAWAAGLKAL
ncbi:MAG: helix-turn-helix domain-containing protein [Bacillota bacterium]